MTWRLAPDVHAVFVGADLVALDVRRGRYACLASCRQDLELDSHTGEVRLSDERVAANLRQAGLIERAAGDDVGRGEPPPPGPLCDLFDAPFGPLTSGQVGDFILAYVAMAWRFRLASFGAIVRRARDFSAGGARLGAAGRPVTSAPISPAPISPALTSPVLTSPTLIKDALAFRKMLPWAPWQGRCLFRSVMLLSFLRRRGHLARLVFAVRTWPFAAHCWVQADDLVLDDAAERLVGYSPILAV